MLNEIDRTEAVIDLLQKINGHEFSSEQLDILRYKKGMSLLAVAGSGKTTTLINLVAKRILNGEISNPSKLLCCTYSKGGATEIETRLTKLLRSCGLSITIPVKTLHAAYVQILKAFGVQCTTDKIISEGERRGIIRELAKENNLGLDDDGVEALDNILSVQVNELLSDDEVMVSSKFTLDNVDKEQYSAIRQGYANRKAIIGKMDFDDMQLYVHNWLCVNKIQQVLEYCWATWEYFYIDEFQDTNKIQFQIMQAMLRDKDKLIVIGDDDQSIYSWRGADPNIILNICGYYDLKKFTLSTNYRCGANIVSYAACCVDKMSHRENKSMGANKEGGTVEIIDISKAKSTSSYKEEMTIMSEKVANAIEEALNDTDDLTMPNEICVMSRNNANLSILNNLLLRKGILCDMANSIKLSNNVIYKDIRKIAKLTGDTISKNDIRETIWKLIPYSGTRCANMVTSVMDEAACGLKEALKYIVNVDCRDSFMQEKIGDGDGVQNVKVSDRTLTKIEYVMNNCKREVRSGMCTLYFTLLEQDEAKRVARLLNMYKVGAGFMFKTQDQTRLLNGMVEYIAQLYQERGFDGADKFLKMSEQYEAGGFAATGGTITLTTIHSAKGKEWKKVFIMADDNFCFPSYYGIQKLEDRNVNRNDMIEFIDSERRLHYVAQTRAKKNLYFVCDIRKASRFILESYNVVSRDNSAYGANNNEIIERALKGGCSNSVGEIDELRKVANIIDA